ncbi:MAG: PASTA domain-containing protein [Betaproteobacteria bacterium]
MPDTWPVSSYDEDRPGWSPFAVMAIAALVLALGVAGAVFGIHVAKVNATAVLGTTTPTPPLSPTPTSAGPTPTTTDTATPPPADSFPAPDLSGMDFQAARQKLRDLKLGWQLVFQGAEGDNTVRGTMPPAGAPVHKGITVIVIVNGPAPLATVPDLRGKSCSDAAAAIVDAGLYPVYDSGRVGSVLQQSPLSTDPPVLHWNDMVHISCGVAPS